MIKALKKVDITPNGCWEWKGYINERGYGQLERNGKSHAAHRFFYEHFKKKIPTGLQIDHLCRNRRCVNPEHLEAVSARVNILRGECPAAKNVKKLECKRGHLLSGENVWLRQSKKTFVWWRECRKCRAEAQSRYRKRKKL